MKNPLTYLYNTLLKKEEEDEENSAEPNKRHTDKEQDTLPACEKLIEKRRKQAHNKDIKNKATEICDYLGRGNSILGPKISERTVFETNNLKITREKDECFSSPTVTIKWKGEKVYKYTLPTITEKPYFIRTYVPGEWENSLEHYYKKAGQAKYWDKKIQKEQSLKNQKENLKNNWRLNPGKTCNLKQHED